MTHSPEKPFNRETIQRLFAEMGKVACERGQTMEIAVYGGSALALAFDWRVSTCDVDYMPVRGAEADIREIAAESARRLGLPEDGLRPDVQIFASDFAELISNGEYPKGMPDGLGLRVFSASPDYLLAMKLLAMRSSLETQDCRDVWHLLDVTDTHSVEDAIAHVSRFYPDKEVPIRHVRIVEDLFEAKSHGADYSQMMGW